MSSSFRDADRALEVFDVPPVSLGAPEGSSVMVTGGALGMEVLGKLDGKFDGETLGTLGSLRKLNAISTQTTNSTALHVRRLTHIEVPAE